MIGSHPMIKKLSMLVEVKRGYVYTQPTSK